MWSHLILQQFFEELLAANAETTALDPGNAQSTAGSESNTEGAESPDLSLDIPDACGGKGGSVSCKSATMASFNSYLNYMLFKQYSHMMAWQMALFTCML